MEAAKSRSQQLQEQVEDLQEKVSLREAGNHGDASLLSELEISLDADLGLWKDEVSRSLLGGPVVFMFLRHLCYSDSMSQHLR